MFRPCIDLHQGQVKQIVGGTLRDDGSGLRTNFVSDRSAAWFAHLYGSDGLKGGHVILLDPKNPVTVAAAREALATYPRGMQVGGGVNPDNAGWWLDAGASQVIATSWVFREGRIDYDRLRALVKAIGRERLVLDLSCRKVRGEYLAVTDRFQKITTEQISPELLTNLASSCAEFLVHAVDVEGLRLGIDAELVAKLADWTPLPTTYAGGARSMHDLEEVTRLSRGRIDLTIGSALDIFGGAEVRYVEVVAFNQRRQAQGGP